MTSPRTARNELRNQLSDLGRSAVYVKVCGDRFVEILTETWYFDGYQSTLGARRLSPPSLFRFSGFNKPESHGHK